MALARVLEQSPYQIVCLQEIQLHTYQNLLVNGCASYPFALFESYVHCPKGGLLTLSRIPTMSTSFVPYSKRGYWYTPMLLDRLFFKGMLITKFTWNDMPIVMINTHLVANFAGDWERRGMYARVEELQLRQLAETVQSQPRDAILFVVGDFNIPRGSGLYRDFLVHSGLIDPMADDTRPTLRMPFRVNSRFSFAIDYVLVQVPDKYSCKIDCDLCFASKYWITDGYEGYLSDHYGIETRMTVTSEH